MDYPKQAGPLGRVTTSQTDDSTSGYLFRCPGCATLPYNSGLHFVRTVKDAKDPGAPVWGFNGNVLEPTFTPSILVNGRPESVAAGLPRCHSFVNSGMIQYLGDCDHPLKGQTVKLPPWDSADPY